MKSMFWLGLTGLLLFEVANVYFIMPMPGSQEMNSVGLAYFLHSWRWVFRVIFGAMILIGLYRAKVKHKWLMFIPLILVGAVTYMSNFVMAADHMFYQPAEVLMVPAASNKVDTSRLVLGVVHNGEAKAYPIRFLGYHHQVQDSIGGKPVIVTYCTVCRTGRVFEPMINGRHEMFRLVGMDHFNAMFEDKSTKSWWRQVNGEAIAGELKGQELPEVFSTQTSLAQWMSLHPNTLVMQEDPAYLSSYDTTLDYESGKSRSKLTGTDSLSWGNKAWVVGIKAGKERRAYDWNQLKEERIIQDKAGDLPVMVVLASDNRSFFAFERVSDNAMFSLSGDTLVVNNRHFRLDGAGIDTTGALKRLPAYQEFWHSWKTFNPGTTEHRRIAR